MTRNFKIVRIVVGTLLSCLGGFLILNNFIPVSKSKYSIKQNQLLTLTGYLSNDPSYYRGGKANTEHFLVELNTYPGVNFQNEAIFLTATDWESIQAEVKYHDTVSLKVLKAAFERNYVNRHSMSFFQRIANSPIEKFDFYSFKFKDKEYVSDLYEAAKRDQHDNTFTRFLIGLVFAGMGIYSFTAKK